MGQRGVHGLVPAHLMHASSTSLSRKTQKGHSIMSWLPQADG